MKQPAKALPWQDRDPKPNKKKKEKDHAAILEEVMKEYAQNEGAHTIPIFAHQRAADALHVSQGQAADGTEETSSAGAPEENRDKAQDPVRDVQQQMEIQQGPTTEAGSPQSAPPWIVWLLLHDVWLRRHQWSNNKLNSISKNWDLKRSYGKRFRQKH